MVFDKKLDVFPNEIFIKSLYFKDKTHNLI